MTHLEDAHFVFSNFFFKYCAIYEIRWKNILEWGRPQMTIWCMHIAFWIPKATDTHTQVMWYSLLFLLQQWLQEHASMLGYMYIACLVM
jgi:hypothetical protein